MKQVIYPELPVRRGLITACKINRMVCKILHNMSEGERSPIIERGWGNHIPNKGVIAQPTFF